MIRQRDEKFPHAQKGVDKNGRHAAGISKANVYCWGDPNALSSCKVNTKCVMKPKAGRDPKEMKPCGFVVLRYIGKNCLASAKNEWKVEPITKYLGVH